MIFSSRCVFNFMTLLLSVVFISTLQAVSVSSQYSDCFDDAMANSWIKKGGKGTFKIEDGGMRITGDVLLVANESAVLENGEIEVEFDQLNDNCGLGLVFRAEDDSYQSIYNSDSAVRLFYVSKWSFRNGQDTDIVVHTDGTPIVKRPGLPYVMKVRFVGDVVTFWVDNHLFFTKKISQAEVKPGRIGIMTTSGTDVIIRRIESSKFRPLDESQAGSEKIKIQNGGLQVILDSNFPRIVEYRLNGKRLSGGHKSYHYVTVNATDYPAAASVIKKTTEALTYRLEIPGADVSCDVIYAVHSDGVVEMSIRNIKENSGLVYTIGFPQQMLISARSDQPGAALAASSGGYDKFINLSNRGVAKDVDSICSIPVIVNNELAASMCNNVIGNLAEFTYRSIDLPVGSVATGFWNSDFMYRGIDGRQMFADEDLWCKIVLTEDTNEDETMNWQDGANALKRLVFNKIHGGQVIRNSFIHIGYNFASVVQQPFLKVADNLKRLSNCIDGFGQIFLLKGYANEGHDSGHADYADINRRAGGENDLRILTQECRKINTVFGVHINHSEAYPEAKMFNDEVMTNLNAWLWLDQARNIRRHKDICDGGMDARLDEMFNRAPGIEFVYVDTYRDGRWAAAKIASSLVDRHNAILATEAGYALERWSAWSHGTVFADGIHRFVYHQQKDVYKKSELLRGGYDHNSSFMSWHGGNNINTVVKQFYTEQLPQKYLMHFDIRHMDSSKVVFSRDVFAENKEGVNKIYKDGRLIASGDMVFIPWYARDSRTQDPDEACKIYHWNPMGGQSTWKVPGSWEDQSNVMLYRTSQTGRELLTTIPVVEGHVSIDAEANTPYVIYKGDSKVETIKTVWSVGSPITDTSFNSRNFSIWAKSSSASDTSHIRIEDDDNGTAILVISGGNDGQVQQTMTNLQPSVKYRASVFAGSKNGKRATIKVVTPDGKTHVNYTENTSIPCFLVHHCTNGRKVQRKWVDFTMPNSAETTARIVLAASNSGENGKVEFMETRIVETSAPVLSEGYVAWEDFENVDQAFGIFIPEKSEQYSHLSQYHEGYTSDTISGEWSLKMRTSFRTTPSTLRLLPDTSYVIQFSTQQKGNVVITAEVGGDTILEKPFEAGRSTFSFTTGDADDYVIRILDGHVLDDFKVFEPDCTF
jgi:endo-alpha-N-acetylgalactosaminidase